MVIAGFYLLTAVMIGSVLWMITGISTATKQVKRKAAISYLTGIFTWLVYVITLSGLGALDGFDFPPKVPLLIVLPVFALIFFFTSRREMKEVIRTTPGPFSVYIQFFRVAVELLIYGAFITRVFPPSVTFEGTNFDILVGLSAPLAGYLYDKNKLSKRGLLAWNIIALSILTVTVFTFVAAFYFTTQSADIALYKFVKLPYILLASVLLPIAVFYHIVSIKQLIGLKH